MDPWRTQLGLRGDEIIGIGIDRIDYTKGISERLRAIDRFLRQHPEYARRFVFVQIGVPSRTRIPEYQLLDDEIDRLVRQVNRNGSWRPVVFLKHHFPQQRLTAL